MKTPDAPIVYHEDTDMIDDSKRWKSVYTLKLLNFYEYVRMQNRKYAEGKQ